MIKNLLSFIRSLTASNSGSAAPTLTVTEGERRLKEAKKGLETARKDYAEGRFSGHPEEALETIEDFEVEVRILTKAKKRGWKSDPKVINEIEYDIHRQREYMSARSYSPAEIASDLEWRHEQLEDAHKGLR